MGRGGGALFRVHTAGGGGGGALFRVHTDGGGGGGGLYSGYTLRLRVQNCSICTHLFELNIRCMHHFLDNNPSWNLLYC